MGWTNTSEIPSELPRHTARNIAERGSVGCCNAQHGESDPDLQEANVPDPAETAWRGLVTRINGEAERCHVHNGRRLVGKERQSKTTIMFDKREEKRHG